MYKNYINIFILFFFIQFIYSQNISYLIRNKRSIAIKKNPLYSNPIRYYISNEIKNKDIIKKSLTYLQHYTCLKFNEIENKIDINGINFMQSNQNSIDFTYYDKNISFVNLTIQCIEDLGCLKHFLAGALGLQPDSSRADRNKFIKIMEENLDNLYTKYYNAENGYSTKIFNTGFDYGSIMLQNTTYGSKNGQPVFNSKLSPYYDYMIGQRNDYSHNDLKLINSFYCPNFCITKIEPCFNGGYPHPYCQACVCPEGFEGRHCNIIARSQGPCGETSLKASKDKKILNIKGQGKCIFSISSKKGTTIDITVDYVKTNNKIRCSQYMGLEIKHRYDKGAMGLCLCGEYRNITIPKTKQNVVIIYNGKESDHEFKISYKMIK
ncbi:Astacin-like metalloendopeptidase [Strongyloides ratti]|uniref:Metalloendopeptidase n=1 Tax=Strongyloides ratti TaxID=34506 RepID=A0A090LJ78_STRRB|nr:Astacin-like metalloendopeptidase [Strongyloides ratti]CEF69887.1 Astacin-like metalloendopeptidase [Strongyloides ratti]